MTFQHFLLPIRQKKTIQQNVPCTGLQVSQAKALLIDKNDCNGHGSGDDGNANVTKNILVFSQG